MFPTRDEFARYEYSAVSVPSETLCRREVDAAAVQRGIGVDVCVGEKSEGVFVVRFFKEFGVTGRRECDGGPGKRSAF